MSSAPPPTTESSFTPPRKRPSVYWWLGGIFLLLVCLFLYLLFGPNPRIIVSKQTTYITAPLTEKGLPDYEAHYHAMFSAGVTPENNAAALLFQALGPGDLNPKDTAAVAKELGLAEVPTTATSLRPLSSDRNRKRIVAWLHEQGRLTLPDGKPAKDEVIQQALNLAPQPLSKEAEAILEEADAEIDRAGSGPWTTDQIPPLAKWLSENQASIDLIVQASQRPRYYAPSPSLLNNDRELLISALLPQLQTSRDAARALRARAMWHLGEGRPNDAWQDVLAIHRLARLLSDDSSILSELVASSISGIACDSTQTILGQGELTPALAQQVRNDLSALPNFSVSKVIDNGERLYALDVVVRCASEGGLKAAFTPDELSSVSAMPVLDAVSIDWNIVLQDVNSYNDQLVAAIALPTREQRLDALSTVEADIAQLEANLHSPSKLIAAAFSIQRRSKLVSGIVASAVFPSVSATVSLQDRTNAMLELNRIAASLAMFKAEHGAYPEKLAELLPATVTKLPVDPFTDNPFRYRRSGAGYLLYSVGQNRTDDGGSNEMLSIFEGISLEESVLPSPPPQIPTGADDISIRLPRPPSNTLQTESEPTTSKAHN